MGRVEIWWISKVGDTVSARLMESQIWHQPTRSVGGRAQQRTMGSVHPDARHISLSL